MGVTTANKSSKELFRQALSDCMPNITALQREVAIGLHELRANAMGKSFDEYVHSEFHGDIFASLDSTVSDTSGKRAGIIFSKDNKDLLIGEFSRDAQALILVTKQSDFVSFIHESAHLFRKQLIGTPLGVQLDEAYGIDMTGWHRDHEERFADDFIQYMTQGKVQDERLHGVFGLASKWLKKLWTTVFSKHNEVDPRIREVMDQLFAAEKTSSSIEQNATDLPAAGSPPLLASDNSLNTGLEANDPLFELSRNITTIASHFPSSLKGVPDIHSPAQYSGILNTFGRGVVDTSGELRCGDAGSSHVSLLAGMKDARRFYYGIDRSKKTVYLVAKNEMDAAFIEHPQVAKKILSFVFNKYHLQVEPGKKLRFQDRAPGEVAVLFQSEDHSTRKAHTHRSRESGLDLNS